MSIISSVTTITNNTSSLQSTLNSLSTTTSVSINSSATENLGLYNGQGQLGSNSSQQKALAMEGNSIIAGSDEITVEILNSDSGYANKIFWSSDNFATKNYLGIDNVTGTINIGKFTPGTKIEFGIDNGVGNFFSTGNSARNIDNYNHAKATETDQGIVIGFEDLYGGGDQDFNDAIIRVSSKASNDNRSGLGDGTNPGQGGGKINSPNQGTDNPSKIIDTIKPVVLDPKAAAAAKAAEAKAKADEAKAAALAKAAELKAAAAAKAAAAKIKADEAKAAAAARAAEAKAAAAARAAEAKAAADAKAAAAKKIAEEKAAAKKGNSTNVNRSGLGDGTNPGKGGGTVNSPNQGTNNPSQSKSVVDKLSAYTANS